jgi:hypothetical protein
LRGRRRRGCFVEGAGRSSSCTDARLAQGRRSSSMPVRNATGRRSTRTSAML